jgi:hypothetical protein
MQSPIQSSLSSPSQDHGYCSNTNGNERQILEKNLERLISERGMEVIGQLTKEMSPQQIERLLLQTKEKLHATNSAPLTNGNPEPSRSRKPMLMNTKGSMNELFTGAKQSSSDEDEDATDKAVMKKGGIMGPPKQDSSSRLNGSAKNLSVRFDPNQVQTSPHMEHNMERRSHGQGHHRKSHHHHSSRSRRAMSRQPERSSYHYHQPMIPR